MSLIINVILEYVRAALSAAKFLSLEPYSIDKLIYEELINGKSNSAEIINNLIEEALNDYEDVFLESEQDGKYIFTSIYRIPIRGTSKYFQTKKIK